MFTMSDLDKLNISESNIQDMVLVKDAAGNEYVRNIKDLKPAKDLSEEDKKKCVQNAAEESAEK